MTRLLVLTLTTLTLACAPPEVVLLEPLAVVNVAPSHGATAIDPSVEVLATFSRDIDGDSVSSETFFLTELDGAGEDVAVVAATVTFDPDTRTAILTPTTALSGATSYRITITPDVTDTEGEQLPAPVTATFTTT